MISHVVRVLERQSVGVVRQRVKQATHACCGNITDGRGNARAFIVDEKKVVTRNVGECGRTAQRRHLSSAVRLSCKEESATTVAVEVKIGVDTDCAGKSSAGGRGRGTRPLRASTQ